MCIQKKKKKNEKRIRIETEMKLGNWGKLSYTWISYYKKKTV